MTLEDVVLKLNSITDYRERFLTKFEVSSDNCFFRFKLIYVKEVWIKYGVLCIIFDDGNRFEIVIDETVDVVLLNEL